MTPFPTVTPDHVVYPTKSIFLTLGSAGGDGGHETDAFYGGRGTPSLIIYGDGQVIVSEGEYRGDEHDAITFLEAQISATEICDLRARIAATGFLDPHETYFTQRDEGMGAGNIIIRVEEDFYSFYGPDVRFLVDDMAAGYQLIRDYRPPDPLIPYRPRYLALWLEEVVDAEGEGADGWPADLPSLTQLQENKVNDVIIIEGEAVEPILDLFNHRLTDRIFRERSRAYRLIPQPLLPHETPRAFQFFWAGAGDYVPVLDCEGEPSLIPSFLATPTPSIIGSAARLSGMGRIYFVTGQYTDKEIWVMESDGSDWRRLTYNLATDDEPVLSPDGQRIAFASDRDGDLETWVMNADGTDAMKLTNNNYADYSPAWSPDGKAIAFVSDRDGGWQESEIYVLELDGLVERRLTNNTARDLHPIWSPGGSQLALIREVYSTGRYFVYIVDLEAPEGVEGRLIEINVQSCPAWSPDGQWLALSNRGSNAEVNIVSLYLKGDSQRTISTGRAWVGSLDWSSDGSYILFSARDIVNRTDEEPLLDLDLFVAEFVTGNITQLTDTYQYEDAPNWWP